LDPPLKEAIRISNIIGQGAWKINEDGVNFIYLEKVLDTCPLMCFNMVSQG
jgi:hypothetical protein